MNRRASPRCYSDEPSSYRAVHCQDQTVTSKKSKKLGSANRSLAPPVAVREVTMKPFKLDGGASVRAGSTYRHRACGYPVIGTALLGAKIRNAQESSHSATDQVELRSWRRMVSAQRLLTLEVKSRTSTPNPSIERTSQRPLRALWPPLMSNVRPHARPADRSPTSKQSSVSRSERTSVPATLLPCSTSVSRLVSVDGSSWSSFGALHGGSSLSVWIAWLFRIAISVPARRCAYSVRMHSRLPASASFAWTFGATDATEAVRRTCWSFSSAMLASCRGRHCAAARFASMAWMRRDA